MSIADTWIDEKSPTGPDREPLGVMLSQIILALGLSMALAVIAMAVIWSSAPSTSSGAGAPGYRASWRPSHHFRAVARASAGAGSQTSTVADKEGLTRRQSPPSA